LAQDRKDLGAAISRHLHQNLLRYLAEKILLPHPLSFGEDYLGISFCNEGFRTRRLSFDPDLRLPFIVTFPECSHVKAPLGVTRV
jgi:hypothetical protein